MCASSAATLAIPLAFKNLIDLGFVQGTYHGMAQGAADGRRHQSPYFLALFGIALVLAVFTAARYYMVSWLGERVTADLRTGIYERMLKQSPQFFETTQTGEVLSRLTADTTLVQTVIGTSVSMGLRNFFLFIGGIIMLVVTNPHAALIIVIIVALVVLLLVLFGRRARQLVHEGSRRYTGGSTTRATMMTMISACMRVGHHQHDDARRRTGRTAQAHRHRGADHRLHQRACRA